MHNCKFCGGSTIKLFDNGIECRDCKTVQVIDLPSVQVLNEYYERFNLDYSGGGNSNNQILYAEKYLELVLNYNNGFESILDVGCSNNPFANLVFEAGKSKVSCLDIVRPQELNSNISFYSGVIDGLNSVPNNTKFEVITAWAVIEHVRNVQLAFQNFSQNLDHGGLLFLTTPEIGTFFSDYSPGKTPWFFPPEHLHILSETCLKSVAELYSLKLIDSGHFEISKLRFFVRYYIIGLLESIIGKLLLIFSKSIFNRFRTDRISNYKGIAFYVFKKI